MNDGGVKPPESRTAFPADWWARGAWLLFGLYLLYAGSQLEFTPARVAAGFEHSVANMYLIPLGIMYGSGAGTESLGWSGFAASLVPVTLGNILGGSVMVALVYWAIYLRRSPGGSGAS